MAKKRTKAQKGRWVRRKGHQFEREVASSMRTIFPNARRHLEYQDGEANGVDIAHTGKYRIQCKKRIAYASINTIDEIQIDPLLGEVPVLVTAGDSLPVMAVIPFYELLELIACAEKSSKD